MRETSQKTATKIFLLLFLLGCLLRLYKLEGSGIWQDEQWCVSASIGVPFIMFDDDHFYNQWTKPWKNKLWEKDTIWKKKEVFSSADFWKLNTLPNVIEATIFASNNPAYNVLLHFWIKSFGISDYSLRSFSVLWGCLTIIIGFLLAKLLFSSNNVALLSTFLIAIHPLLIYESQSAKAHSMAIFLSLTAVYFFIKIVKNSDRRLDYIGYFICTLAALLTHMLTIYVFIGTALIMLFFIRGWSIWLKVCLVNVLAAGIYAGWLYNGGFESIRFLDSFVQFIQKYSRDPAWMGKLFFIPATFPDILRAIEKTLLFVFGNTLFNVNIQLRFLIPLLLIPITIIILGFIKSKSRSERNSQLWLATLIFTQLLFASVISIKDKHILQFSPVNSVYVIPFALILMAAAMISNFKRKPVIRFFLVFLFALHVSLMFYGSFNVYFHPKDQGGYDFTKAPNYYKAIAGAIKRDYSKNDTVVYSLWRHAQNTNLYLKDEPQIFQKVDTLQPHNLVILAKHSEPGRITLFDFDKTDK